MQKIGQLQTYVEVLETQGAVFVHPDGNPEQARLIKMRILAEGPVKLYVEAMDADPETGVLEDMRFLAYLNPGMEQIEFFYRGTFALRLVGGNVWLDTYDNTSFNVESADPTSFTRLWEREERDPAILELERAARHNQMRMQEQMAAERAAFAEQMAQLVSQAQANVSSSSNASVTPAASGGTQGSGVSSADDKSNGGTASSGTGGEPKADA